MVALGNGLPGVIATKFAAHVGFDLGGFLGAGIALIATIAPSMIMMLALFGVLMKFKDSVKVVKLTRAIRPVIGVLLGVMAYNFFINSSVESGWIHTVIKIGRAHV